MEPAAPAPQTRVVEDTSVRQESSNKRKPVFDQSIPLKAPFTSFKTLSPELIDYAHTILRHMRIVSDPKFKKKFNKIITIWPMLTDNSSAAAQFLVLVTNTVSFSMPCAWMMRKFQEEKLIEKTEAFIKKADEMILEIIKEKQEIDKKLSAFEISALESDDHKNKLEDLKLSYNGKKKDLNLEHAKLIKAIDKRINDAAKIDTQKESIERHEAISDNTKEYITKINRDCASEKCINPFVKLKNEMLKKAVETKLKYDAFEADFNKLNSKIENNYLPVAVNTVVFEVGYYFGFFNEIKNVDPHQKYTIKINEFVIVDDEDGGSNKIDSSKVKLSTDITKIDEEEDLFLIKLFELILNKKSKKKENIQDLTLPVVTDNMPDELKKRKIELIQLGTYVNNWTPYKNEFRTNSDNLLCNEIDDFDDRIQNLKEYIGKSTKNIDKYIVDVRKNILEMSFFSEYTLNQAKQSDDEKLIKDKYDYIKHVDKELTEIPIQRDLLKLKVEQRMALDKPALISGETSIAYDDITPETLLNFDKTFSDSTIEIKKKLDAVIANIATIDGRNTHYKKRYSFLRYLMEVKDGTENHFKAWYLTDYNYFKTDKLIEEIKIT